MKKNIDRREFFKMAGGGVAASAAVACAGEKGAKAVGVTSEKPLGEMVYREGPSGDKVSLLGYGCMRWPMIDDGNGGKKIDQDAVNELVDYAMAHGVNYYDTAPVYLQGQSQAASALALSRYPRDSYYLATKLSTQRLTGSKMYEASLEMYRNSFKQMNVDYIDYYLLHCITSKETYISRFIDSKVIDFLLKEREAGRIRHLGYSVHCDMECFDYILADHDKYHWDFVQIQMNYVDWVQDAEYMYNELAKRNIPVVIMEPLLGGQLSTLNDMASGKLRALRPSESVASWAFRFCGTMPGVLTVLSGMTYMEHLQDNLRTYSPLEPLEDSDFKLLDEIAREFIEFPLVPCTACNYCMPCPYGVDIPGVFLHYNKCLNEGMVKSDEGDPAYRKARRAFLVGLDRNLDLLRQADHCIGCKKCMPKCPQRIRIPQQMRRIDEFVENLRLHSDII